MKSLRFLKSAILASVLLWQSLLMLGSFQTSVSSEPKLGLSQLEASIQRFCLLESVVPSILEIKRQEPAARSSEGAFSGLLQNQVAIANFRLQQEQSESRRLLNATQLPVKRGYWLLYRSLLL